MDCFWFVRVSIILVTLHCVFGKHVVFACLNHISCSLPNTVVINTIQSQFNNDTEIITFHYNHHFSPSLSSSPSNHRLSNIFFSYQRKVEHYRVMYHNDKLTVDEESMFTNLTQLVDVS